MSTSFLAKYRDPRWQRLRLEVMEEAGFQCQECYSETETLNVHHRLYRKGADPWEYDLDELVCLCQDCHRYIHELKKRIDLVLSRECTQGLEYFVGYLEASVYEGLEKDARILTTTNSMAKGVADCFDIPVQKVIDICFEWHVSVEQLYDLKLEFNRNK